jgi:L-ascorbate metabolism protein UlaG (beta-lactamase superfamily)
VDIGGLRIDHVGDTEQKALTEELHEALGNVDVAFMEFRVDSDDKYKYFDMMDQAKPRLTIGTRAPAP